MGYPVVVCGKYAIFHPFAPNNDNAFNPCFITWLLSFFAVVSFVACGYSLVYSVRKPKYGNYLPKSTGLTHYIRTNSVLLHAILFGYLTSFTDIHERFADTKIIAFYSVTIVLFSIVLPLHFIETTHSPRPHDSLILFWPLLTLLQAVLFFQDNYTDWRVLKLVSSSSIIETVEFLLILNSVSIFVMEYSSNYWKPSHQLTLQYSKDESSAQKLSSPNIIDRVTFSWMNGLIMESFRNETVTQTDLPNSPEELSAVVCTNRLLKYWSFQRNNPSLVIPMVKAFGSIAGISFSYEFTYRVLNFVQPQLLRLLIKYFDEKNPPLLKGFLICVLMFLITILQTSFNNQYFLKNLNLGLACRSSLTSLIYQKSLKLSSEAKIQTSSADIINLMTVDVNRIQAVSQDLSTLVLAPTDVILCVISLWPLLGRATFAGVATMIVLIPFNGIIARKLKKLNKVQMKLKDDRGRVINDILTSIKSIKLYAWEKPMLSILSDSRNNKELKNLVRIRKVNQFGVFLWVLMPFLISFASFSTFALTESIPLTSEIVFPALALLNLLSGPLLSLPQVITSMIEASVAVDRIRKFLLSEEINEEVISRLPKAVTFNEESLKIENSTFLWSRGKFSESSDETHKHALKDIDFTVKKGQLSCIVGKVGSGKSSLLYGLLGQLIVIKGTDASREPSIQIRGSIAYCAQLPWIMNASVKENILFGCRYEEDFYRQTVEACQLEPDLEILPDGDDTQVGEKGVSLSGGQKARLALARAVYARADVYLLDDILSAVDSHVGKKIIEKVLSKQGLLSLKTIVLCTNSMSVLNYSDEITLIQSGRITERSTFADINASNHPALHELVSEFGKSDTSVTPSVASLSKNNSSDNILKLTSSDEYGEGEFANTTPSSQSVRRASIETFRWEPLKKLLPNLRSGQMNEVSQKGKVDWAVYVAYAKACSVPGVIVWFFLLVLTSSLSVGGNYWLKHWTEQNSETGSNDNVWRFIIVYALFGLGGSLMTMLRGLVMSLWLAINASVKIHDQMASRILKAPMSYFERTPVGRIMNRFTNDINKIDQQIPGTFSGFFSQMIKTVFTFGVVGIVMPFYIVVIVILSTLYVYYEIYYVSISRELKRLVSISRSPIYAHLGESLNGLETIRAFDQFDRFDYINNSNLDFNLKSVYMLRSINRWLTFRLQFIGSIGVFSASTLAVYSLTTANPLSSSMAGFVMTYALQVTSSLKMVVKFSAEVETNIVAVERCLEYSTLPIEEEEFDVDGNPVKFVKPPLVWPQEGNIKFNNYSTRYRANLDLILKNITMEIKSGEKVGIVGRTGAGKSSLALSIFRIIEPVEGNIVIDDLNTSSLSLYDLRHNLSIIPQDSQLIAGTVRQNLDPFNYYTDDELWKALELSHLKDHILAMDIEDNEENGEITGSKLQAKVFEGGSNFSLGQRQLMSLARVLLKMEDSTVLVLDEATAAVDVQTDRFIQETIRAEFKDKTIVTIAHRLETVMDSDRIVTLDKGELKEFDTPANLLKNEDGIFYSLCKQGGYI